MKYEIWYTNNATVEYFMLQVQAFYSATLADAQDDNIVSIYKVLHPNKLANTIASDWQLHQLTGAV